MKFIFIKDYNKYIFSFIQIHGYKKIFRRRRKSVKSNLTKKIHDDYNKTDEIRYNLTGITVSLLLLEPLRSVFFWHQESSHTLIQFIWTHYYWLLSLSTEAQSVQFGYCRYRAKFHFECLLFFLFLFLNYVSNAFAAFFFVVNIFRRMFPSSVWARICLSWARWSPRSCWSAATSGLGRVVKRLPVGAGTALRAEYPGKGSSRRQGTSCELREFRGHSEKKTRHLKFMSFFLWSFELKTQM